MTKKQISYQGIACKLGKVVELPPPAPADFSKADNALADNPNTNDEKSFYGLKLDCKGKLLGSLKITVEGNKTKALILCKDSAKIGKKPEDVIETQKLFYGSVFLHCPHNYGLSSIAFSKSDIGLMVNYKCVPVPLGSGLVTTTSADFKENNPYKFLAQTNFNSHTPNAITTVYWKVVQDEKGAFQSYQLITKSKPMA